MSFTPSVYQEEIRNWILTPKGHLVVIARAGSGKTTTAAWSVGFLPTDVEIGLCAFNADIVKVMKTKVSSDKTVKTYHAFGRQIIVDNFGFVRLEENRGDKLKSVLRNKYPRERYGHLYFSVGKLLTHCKNTVSEPNPDTLDDFATYYSVGLGEENVDRDIIFEMTRHAFYESLKQPRYIDFDDMIFLPVYNELEPRQKFDYLFCDEFQDTNLAHGKLIKKMIHNNGHIIGIGDPAQSIYAFNGADSNAIGNLIESLSATVMTLPVTYRNPQVVVDLVNQRFPEIKLQSRDNCPPGILGILDNQGKMLDSVVDGDMVLCRTNAPMIKPVFTLLRQGKKAIIKGKDIGDNLITIVKNRKANGGGITDFITKLMNYKEQEISKLMAAEKYSVALALQDKIETIMVFTENVNTTDELINKIRVIFSDDLRGVVFSTIHKAKGLENSKIYILRPDLLPHPMAKKSWERVQEGNLEYVGYTRAIDELYIVNGQ